MGELEILDLHVYGLHGGLRPSRRDIHIDPEQDMWVPCAHLRDLRTSDVDSLGICVLVKERFHAFG